MINRMKSLARQAGQILRDAAPEHVTSKEGVGNYVTEYDVRVQKMLYDGLMQLHPGAAWMGEEDESHTADMTGDCFIVDPLDGTQNFINNYRHSCVSIGLARDGEPVLGVVYNPYLDEMFWAEKGKGAYCNGKPIHTVQSRLEESIFLFGSSPYNRKEADLTFRVVRALFDRTLDLRRSGSAALDLCYVAAGRANLFLEHRLSPWDFCAGAVIVREAGGHISQWNGEELNLVQGGSVVAAGPNAYCETVNVIHKELDA